MSQEVSININLFHSNLSKLQTAVADINLNKTTHSFGKTNIEPFTKDLENIIETMELLERYKSILQADVTTLEKTGEQMREKDEELARVQPDSYGPQPIR